MHDTTHHHLHAFKNTSSLANTKFGQMILSIDYKLLRYLVLEELSHSLACGGILLLNKHYFEKKT
jgi:hypothetical protein